MAMTKLGTDINGVIITYTATSNADVTEELLEAMKKILRTQIADSSGGVLYNLNSIHISSTSEACSAHTDLNGPHRSGRAVDIDMINNKGVRVNYPTDDEVQSICDALQVSASLDPNVVENFGPLACFQPYKGGYIQIGGERNKTLIEQHKSHLHFGVVKRKD